MESATDDIIEKLNALLIGERVIAKIDQNVVYRSLTENVANIYRLLLDAGYLKIFDKKLQGDGTWLCNAKIPNREIFTIYKSEIMTHVDK